MDWWAHLDSKVLLLEPAGQKKKKMNERNGPQRRCRRIDFARDGDARRAAGRGRNQ